MNYNKEAKSLTSRRGSEVSQVSTTIGGLNNWVPLRVPFEGVYKGYYTGGHGCLV